MFERYTEKARRVIFFARYEASLFGAPAIETEHILLGIIREDKSIANRFFSGITVDDLRKDIQSRTVVCEMVSTSVDLPLSTGAKNVLAFAAEESERLQHRHIDTEHLLLGLLHEEMSVAATILRERGLHLLPIREEVKESLKEEEQTDPEAIREIIGEMRQFAMSILERCNRLAKLCKLEQEADTGSSSSVGGMIGALAGGINGEIFKAFIEQFQAIEVVDLDSKEITGDLLKLVPQETAERYRLLPIARTADSLTVVMANPFDQAAINALAALTKLKIVVTRSPAEAIKAAMEKYYANLD